MVYRLDWELLAAEDEVLLVNALLEPNREELGRFISGALLPVGFCESSSARFNGVLSLDWKLPLTGGTAPAETDGTPRDLKRNEDARCQLHVWLKLLIIITF